ncbi:MAG: transglycosylase SLT domain-containing protein [Saprospiraceae bacterium]
MKSILVLMLSLIFSIGLIQAQAFKFPSKVRIEGNKSYTYEALEAKEKRAESSRTAIDVSDEVYRERVSAMSGEIPTKFNTLIKSHIRNRVVRWRTSTEQVVSRSMVYFPIFEETLRRYNLPTDLKYLSIVESSLNPRAVSTSGATGLWQFMKPTGKEYGLRINGVIDERRDVHASTDAAARYLAHLYDRYGDWHLAIASYNCGPGCVNKAVKKAGKSDYWAAAAYLPKETRNYVPAFIGASYAMNYYHLHNIYPEHPEYDLQIMDKIRVFDKITFKRISELTGITVEAIRFMNPSFNQSYIPANSKGYIVSLPLTVMGAFQAAVRTEYVTFGSPTILSYEEKKTYSTPSVSTTIENHTIYQVTQDDNLAKVAQRYNCTVKELREWNDLKGSALQVDQQLVVAKGMITQNVYTSSQNTMTSTSVNHTQNTTLHKVEKGESLSNIASKYNIKVDDILKANNMTGDQKVQPEMQLIIPDD